MLSSDAENKQHVKSMNMRQALFTS